MSYKEKIGKERRTMSKELKAERNLTSSNMMLKKSFCESVSSLCVIPAKAGIQSFRSLMLTWIPRSSRGMTNSGLFQRPAKLYILSFILVVLCSMLFAFYSALTVDAAVSGPCSYCHSFSGGIKLKTDCIGCHGQNPSGSQSIIPIDGGRIPQVLHHMPGGDLAAGNFYYVADGYNPDYIKGHNLAGISNREVSPKDVPMGFIGSVVIPGGIGPLTWSQQKQLTCSGTWGCHGNRTIEDPWRAIAGAHHADDSAIDGSTIGTSYRFLYGIKGKEHANWEYQATINNHNGYKGDRNYSSMDTISYLCGECHAQYHLHPNLGGYYNQAWIRHPVDISFGIVHGGYSNSEYKDYATYSFETPVAYTNPLGNETEVDMNSIVMCLSCHRAHASPYQSSLRFDYSNIIPGSGGNRRGCFNCHTQKLQ